MIRFTVMQLLSIADKGGNITNWEVFSDKALNGDYLDYLENQFSDKLEAEITTPIEKKKVTKILKKIASNFSSFEELREKRPIDNNNLVLLVSAIVEFSDNTTN